MASPSGPIRPLPAAPTESNHERAHTSLTIRIILVATIVVGQLWALTVALEAFLLDRGHQAWLLAGFSIVSFGLSVALVRIEPPARRPPSAAERTGPTRSRPGRR